MKKKKVFFIKNANIPKIKMYTKLLGVFYVFLGLNCLLVYFYTEMVHNWGYSNLFLILTFVMFGLVPLVTHDPRVENRNLSAVIGNFVVFTVCTLIISYFLRWMILVFIAELTVIILICNLKIF